MVPARQRTVAPRVRTDQRRRRASLLKGRVAASFLIITALALSQVVSVQATPSQGAIYRGPTANQTVALTFDDGYAPERCLHIADILTEHGVPATWFPNGMHVAAAPKVWRSIAARFPIANHTLNHPSLVGMPANRIKRELQANEALIERVTGRRMTRILRPTFGAYDDRVLRVAGDLGYRVVLWDTTAADTSPRGTDRGIAANALGGDAGSIVLMHCGPEATPRILPIVIARYACAGYRFATLPALLAGRPGKKARVDCPPPRLPARGRTATEPPPVRKHAKSKSDRRADRGAERRQGRPAVHATDAMTGTPASTDTDIPSGLERFHGQTPTWTACGDGGTECATIEVPLDYAEPEAGAVDLGLIRVKAQAETARSLVLNPGASGGSGATFAAQISSGSGQALLSAYDLVVIETRDGVTADSAFPVPGPIGPAEIAARDLEVLRSALGQEQLHYYGTACGTVVGATYAWFHPERVGRMVLDTSADLTAGCEDWPVTSTSGIGEGQGPDRGAALVAIVTERDLRDAFVWGAPVSGDLVAGVIVSGAEAGPVGYGTGDDCVDEAVDAYFLDGALPVEGATC